MKIIREMSRKYNGNSYFKYKVNLPYGAVARAKFTKGDEVEISAEPGTLTLFSKGKNKQEFDGIRSKLYKEAIRDFPEARLQEVSIMKKYLAPKTEERILEIGAGSGFFSKIIADIIGEKGRLIVSEPSLSQLEEIRTLGRKNIDIIQYVQFGSESVDLEKDKVDAIWSLGAMHHIRQKTKLFLNMHRILKKNGRVIIADVFVGSKLAKHFDDSVAKYSITGHEVAFLSKEYAETLCHLTGFTKPRFYETNIKWKFKNKSDIGIFLYKLHAMTKITPKECLKEAEEILGISYKDGYYQLNWPITIFTTKINDKP